MIINCIRGSDSGLLDAYPARYAVLIYHIAVEGFGLDKPWQIGPYIYLTKGQKIRESFAI